MGVDEAKAAMAAAPTQPVASTESAIPTSSTPANAPTPLNPNVKSGFTEVMASLGNPKIEPDMADDDLSDVDQVDQLAARIAGFSSQAQASVQQSTSKSTHPTGGAA